MRYNVFLRLLTSIPVILAFLYFIPFLGICLVLFRQFIGDNKKRISTSVILIIVGILMLALIGLNLIFNLIGFDKTAIPYFNEILDSQIYTINIIKYSKLSITTGVVLSIISFVINNIFQKLGNNLKAYIINREKRDAEISQKNDLVMKEKREKAKNTHVLNCPYCGSDNMLTEQTGTCKFCRRKIEYK